MNRSVRLRRLAQASMGLATNFDEVGATKQNVMSDQRDFSRPRESFYTSNAPSDLFNADDVSITKDPFVMEVQKFLKTKPLGTTYSGNITGIIDPILISALTELETKLQRKYPDKIFVGTIVNGNKINQNGFARAIKALNSKVEEDKTTELKSDLPNISGDENIKKFQAYFGQPQTGIVDDKLIISAKAVESKIAKITNNPNVIGLLWDDNSKKFKTTVADVQEALKRLQEFESTK